MFQLRARAIIFYAFRCNLQIREGGMYTSKVFPLLKLHLRICKFLKCLPFDDGLKRLTKCRSTGRILIFRVQCVLSSLYCAAFFLNLCHDRFNLPQKVQGFIFFVLYVGQAIIRWNYDLDNSGIQIINAFMDFESHLTWGISKNT